MHIIRLLIDLTSISLFKIPIMSAFLLQTICNFFNFLDPLMPLGFSKNSSLWLWQHSLLHFANLYLFLPDPTSLSSLLKSFLIHRSVKVSLFWSPIVSWYTIFLISIIAMCCNWFFFTVSFNNMLETWKWGLLAFTYFSMSSIRNALISISESNDFQNRWVLTPWSY